MSKYVADMIDLITPTWGTRVYEAPNAAAPTEEVPERRLRSQWGQDIINHMMRNGGEMSVKRMVILAGADYGIVQHWANQQVERGVFTSRRIEATRSTVYQLIRTGGVQ